MPLLTLFVSGNSGVGFRKIFVISNGFSDGPSLFQLLHILVEIFLHLLQHHEKFVTDCGCHRLASWRGQRFDARCT
eukprot:1223513-Ditylum_brightwellii.AAC.1